MTQAPENVEVVVIGAGIAGVSLSYFLAERGVSDVLVVEREPQSGYHATGRSAATVVELDPVQPVEHLKILGAQFLRNPPSDFAENEILDQRGVLCIYREPSWSALGGRAEELAEKGMRLRLLTPAEANARVDGMLNEDQFDGAALLPEDGFIDVHELLSSYGRHARARGARFRLDCEVLRLVVEDGRCVGVVTPQGEVRARWVVNAAGAWVGEIARESGATPIVFQPMRRCIAMFSPPDGASTNHWPLVWSDPHSLYFRPEATGILFCPMDEEPMTPRDASADETVIAEGLERLRSFAPTLVPRSLGRRWAGLRTFSPDRVPVVGEDPRLPGFFWLAGQGGCGIETSGAVGQIAADLLTSGATERFDQKLLAPGRFGDQSPVTSDQSPVISD